MEQQGRTDRVTNNRVMNGQEKRIGRREAGWPGHIMALCLPL